MGKTAKPLNGSECTTLFNPKYTVCKTALQGTFFRLTNNVTMSSYQCICFLAGICGSECQRGVGQVPLTQGHAHQRLRGRRGLSRGGKSKDCDITLTV